MNQLKGILLEISTFKCLPSFSKWSKTSLVNCGSSFLTPQETRITEILNYVVFNSSKNGRPVPPQERGPLNNSYELKRAIKHIIKYPYGRYVPCYQVVIISACYTL
ncbi:hypothetical protein CEXT_101481 [Caerostris extrusa]|uniref:Uncharacterized protein n=1 Tax=Caerostris extrusa TaxID=172846 RepID=A0AAV4TE66_CAEEX|nr:hypothetical protein CEXT_101481 [Caerostris extrusa]